MIELINEIRFNLENNNLRVALGMALTLPDICGNVMYKNKKTSVKDRYEGWCKKYLHNQQHITTIVGGSNDNHENNEQRVIDPEHCYKLRCSYLHSGNADLNQKEKDDYPLFELMITSTENSGIYMEPYTLSNGKIEKIKIDVRHLCSVICYAAEEFYNSSSKEEFVDHSFKIIDIEKMLQQLG